MEGKGEGRVHRMTSRRQLPRSHVARYGVFKIAQLAVTMPQIENCALPHLERLPRRKAYHPQRTPAKKQLTPGEHKQNPQTVDSVALRQRTMLLKDKIWLSSNDNEL